MLDNNIALQINRLLQLLLIIGTSLVSLSTPAAEWRGLFALEFRQYLQDKLDSRQYDNYLSAVINPEFYHAWDNNRHSLTISPFYRWDEYDEQRSHADMRELYWLYIADSYEFSVGLRKVFWGTTESQHLVDVINQTDLVENPDGEDKLGQPMLASLVLTDWGNVELYVLPYFRERTFPGKHGRLRTIPRVDTEEAALYEDSKRNKHIDLALRWSNTLQSWDIGLSYFNGTNREPLLVPTINSEGEPVLLPFYELMQQSGLDIQGAEGALLWKMEAIYRDTRTTDYFASTAGLEYTFVNPIDSGIDISVLAEYLYDDRGPDATSPFDDDVMLGIRMTTTDVDPTELLFAVIADRSSEARIYRLELKRRITNHLKLNLEGMIFSNLQETDPFFSFQQDDYLKAELVFFF